MARMSSSMLFATLCAVLALAASAAAPPTKQGGVSQPNYIVCAQGLNHCCCNRLPFKVEAHRTCTRAACFACCAAALTYAPRRASAGPVTAEPTRSFFIDGNNQQYTCFQSSCQANCANKFKSPDCS